MAKTKEITIGEQKFTLQSVSPSWYYDFNDECGNTGSGKRKSAKYMDGIPATGWKTDSSVPGYTNYIDIAISGLTAADYVAVDVVPASSAVARAANFVATESRAGILRLRAASVPTAAISAQYHIITAATAAKEG